MHTSCIHAVFLSGAAVQNASPLPVGLIGHNFLAILEMAKKNVLQPGAVVVPCAASLYVMGIHVPSPQAGSYDLSALEKYRSDLLQHLQCAVLWLLHTCCSLTCPSKFALSVMGAILPVNDHADCCSLVYA